MTRSPGHFTKEVNANSFSTDLMAGMCRSRWRWRLNDRRQKGTALGYPALHHQHILSDSRTVLGTVPVYEVYTKAVDSSDQKEAMKALGNQGEWGVAPGAAHFQSALAKSSTLQA